MHSKLHFFSLCEQLFRSERVCKVFRGKFCAVTQGKSDEVFENCGFLAFSHRGPRGFAEWGGLELVQYSAEPCFALWVMSRPSKWTSNSWGLSLGPRCLTVLPDLYRRFPRRGQLIVFCDFVEAGDGLFEAETSFVYHGDAHVCIPEELAVVCV